MKKILFQIAIFVLTLAVHLFYFNWHTLQDTQLMFDMSPREFWRLYLNTMGQVSGMTYALTAAFVTYVILKYREMKNGKYALKGAAAALLLFLILYFALGLNGRWLFALYVNKFSWIYSAVVAPLTFLITIISVSTGYIYIFRKSRGEKSNPTD
jgi:hypothetical protein